MRLLYTHLCPVISFHYNILLIIKKKSGLPSCAIAVKHYSDVSGKYITSQCYLYYQLFEWRFIIKLHRRDYSIYTFRDALIIEKWISKKLGYGGVAYDGNERWILWTGWRNLQYRADEPVTRVPKVARVKISLACAIVCYQKILFLLPDQRLSILQYICIYT